MSDAVARDGRRGAAARCGLLTLEADAEELDDMVDNVLASVWPGLAA